MSLRLTLICQGATAAVRAARFPADEPLEPLGVARASELAGGLTRVDTAWTSPALSAVQTAAALGLTAVVDPALDDIDLGHWAGKTLAAVAMEDPQGVARWNDDASARPHGGESISDLLERVGLWLGGVGSGEGRFVAVTHAAVLRAAIVIALDAMPLSFWRIDVAPLCVVRLQGRPGRWTLRSLKP